MRIVRARIVKRAVPGLVLAGLLLCGNVRAQIILQDGSTTGITKNNGPTSVTNAFTVTAGASVLVVSTYVQNNVGSDVAPSISVWGSQSFTQVAGEFNSAEHLRLERYFLGHQPDSGHAQHYCHGYVGRNRYRDGDASLHAEWR